jgi:hypothetical protein
MLFRGFALDHSMLTRSDLIALARKYRTLSELRRSQLATALEARGPLRRLADEFPGALRELDTLPLDQIEQRAEALERAASGAPRAAWMEWMTAYHQAMRAALFVKRRVGRERELGARDAFRLATEAARESGYACDAEFVLAVARPPDGRLNTIVYARLEAAFQLAPGDLDRALFSERSGGGFT